MRQVQYGYKEDRIYIYMFMPQGKNIIKRNLLK